MIIKSGLLPLAGAVEVVNSEIVVASKVLHLPYDISHGKDCIVHSLARAWLAESLPLWSSFLLYRHRLVVPSKLVTLQTSNHLKLFGGRFASR
jgi:hypothetical protein